MTSVAYPRAHPKPTHPALRFRDVTSSKGRMAKGARVAFNNPYLTRVQGGLGVSHASMRFRVYPLEGVKWEGASRSWRPERRTGRGYACNGRRQGIRQPIVPTGTTTRERSGQKVPQMTADPRDDQGTKRGRL